MQVALVELADRKLRDAKEHARSLLTQWQQTINNIEHEAERVGFLFIPTDCAGENPVELLKQLPEANYLTTVEIRGRAIAGWNTLVNHARSSLEHEIRRLESVLETEEKAVDAARSDLQRNLTAAKSLADDNAKFYDPPNQGSAHGCAFLIVGVISEVVLLISLMVAAAPHLSSPSLRPGTYGGGLFLLLFLATLFGGWIVGPILLMIIARWFSKLEFQASERQITRRYEDHKFTLMVSLAKSQSEINVAKTVLSRLPVSIRDVVVTSQSESGEPASPVETVSPETQKMLEGARRALEQADEYLKNNDVFMKEIDERVKAGELQRIANQRRLNDEIRQIVNDIDPEEMKDDARLSSFIRETLRDLDEEEDAYANE